VQNASSIVNSQQCPRAYFEGLLITLYQLYALFALSSLLFLLRELLKDLRGDSLRPSLSLSTSQQIRTSSLLFLFRAGIEGSSKRFRPVEPLFQYLTGSSNFKPSVSVPRGIERSAKRFALLEPPFHYLKA